MHILVNKRWGTQDKVLVMLYPDRFWDVPTLLLLTLLTKRWRKTWHHYGSWRQFFQGKYGAHTMEREIESTDYPDCAGC